MSSRIGPRVRAGMVVLFVAAVGFTAGMAFERHHHTRPSAQLSPAEEHEAAMTELREDLGLDDEQIARIHEVLARRHQVVQRSWEELRPEVQNAMRQAHIDIGELLRPDQRERFHEWLRRRREQGRLRYELDLHER